MRSSKGFTLLELMVTVAIMGILLSIALPNYRNMQDNAVATTIINEWRDSFYYAQAEAMRLKRDIIFCASQNGADCAGQFNDGWIVKDDTRVLRDVVPSVPDNYGLNMKLNTSGGDNLTIAANGNIKGFAGATVQAYIKKVSSGKILAKRGLVISREGRIKASNDFTVTDSSSSKSGD